ncbi:MAG TPA: DUF397 domain-containing protein [Rugosimonospora sp.]|nr:DUF397 domain-containing protein [Rugosimonospora sp.]
MTGFHNAPTGPLIWWKSSRSAQNGCCVEVARHPDGGVAVRDSMAAAGDVLCFAPLAWSDFVAAVKADEFR